MTMTRKQERLSAFEESRKYEYVARVEPSGTCNVVNQKGAEDSSAASHRHITTPVASKLPFMADGNLSLTVRTSVG